MKNLKTLFLPINFPARNLSGVAPCSSRIQRDTRARFVAKPRKSVFKLLTLMKKLEGMSYKDRKLKKSRFNQLKRSIGLIKIALWKKTKQFLPKKEADMIQKLQVIMEKLRLVAKNVRPNNKKISSWIERYLEDCLVFGKPALCLTQFCLSKDLEVRRVNQGGRFKPTPAEKELAFTEIPRILKIFEKLKIKLSWWFTFNRSYLDSGRMDSGAELEYKEMIKNLFQTARFLDQVMLLDWEDDVLLSRPAPAKVSDSDFEKLVAKEAFQIEFERHSAWAKNEAGLEQTDRELKDDVRFQILCEVEEGRLLTSEESPLGGNGQLILVPLELAERYVFFEKLSPGFSERIAALLKPYPWRLAE